MTPQLAICIVAYKDLGLNMRVARQVETLLARGHHVTVVAFKRPDPASLPESRHLSILETGVPRMPAMMSLTGWLWRALPAPLGLAGASHLADTLAVANKTRCQQFMRQALNSVAGERFDLVQGHHEKSLIAAQAIARSSGARLLFDAVEIPFAEELNPLEADLLTLRKIEIERERSIALGADGWATVNDSIADLAVERFHVQRPTVVRNCLPLRSNKTGACLKADLGLGQSDRVLVYLNSVRRGEGLGLLIEALARLPDNVHLAMLSPVTHKDVARNVARRAERLRVDNRVHHLPLQPPSEVSAYIRNADLGVVPRQGDGENMRLSLPNRVFLLIAAGLPLAVSRLPEIAGLVREHGIGAVFDESDPASIATTVVELLTPERLAATKQAVAQASETLNWEQESQMYVACVEELAAADERVRRRA